MDSATIPADSMMQQTRSNIQMFSRSDDKAMMKQIQNTHSPDAREFDVKLLLYLIEDIFHHYTPSDILGLGLANATQSQSHALEDNTLQNSIRDIVELLANPIDTIFLEVSSKCSRGSDAHTTTLALFNILSSYSWDAKVVIALAAFSINWGELWLVHQHYQFNPLAEYIASTKEAKELSSLAHKVSNIYSHLQKQLTLCYQHIEEKKYNEAFQKLELLFETTHIDNINILKALVSAEEDQLPLFDGSTKRKVSIDVLRNKNVLLLISDLDLSNEEHFILCQIHILLKEQPTTLESQYEVVWFPVVDRTTPWNDEKQQKFEARQASISWYSVFQPLMFDPVVIKYIKEVWHFNKKALLVVLDPQGKVVHPNAIHMCWIWGNMAFPFTSLKEKELWKETRWTMELLADSIDLSILDWIVDDKYTCLYGGDDLEWIRRFSKTAQAVAATAHIQLEILYVGKSKARGTVQKISNTILLEKLSHVLSDPTLVWFFWVRLEACGIPRDNSLKARGDTMLQSLVKFEEWKDHAKEVGFVNALDDKLYELHTPEHCNHMILSCTAENILERVVCVECGRPMEKYITYRCCN
ncbi:hypothetical protein ACSBR1_036897 [Camellia fascicularis]